MTAFNASDLSPLQSWEKGPSVSVCIGIDVGGSGLRVRISNSLKPIEYVDLPHVKASSTADTQSLLADLQSKLSAVDPNFVTLGTALAVAGPISGDRVVVTNWSGDPSLRTIILSELPQRLFPAGRTVLLNDLEAGAYGILAQSERGGLEGYFKQLWPEPVAGTPIISPTRTAVLAMGSGYGVALILKTQLLDEPLVLGTELGHVQIPQVLEKDPGYADERGLLQFISNHYYGGVQMPEFEDVASGRGIVLAYQYALGKRGKEIPAELPNAGGIAGLAKGGDEAAREAIFLAHKFFTRSAKSIATSLSCDSILLALDNQVKDLEFVESFVDLLKTEFYTWIRPEWLNGIRVYTQKQVLNFNILGTDYMAHRLANRALKK